MPKVVSHQRMGNSGTGYLTQCENNAAQYEQRKAQCETKSAQCETDKAQCETGTPQCESQKAQCESHKIKLGATRLGVKSLCSLFWEDRSKILSPFSKIDIIT